MMSSNYVSPVLIVTLLPRYTKIENRLFLAAVSNYAESSYLPTVVA